jgi:hypothetical protein
MSNSISAAGPRPAEDRTYNVHYIGWKSIAPATKRPSEPGGMGPAAPVGQAYCFAGGIIICIMSSIMRTRSFRAAICFIIGQLAIIPAMPPCICMPGIAG